MQAKLWTNICRANSPIRCNLKNDLANTIQASKLKTLFYITPQMGQVREENRPEMRLDRAQRSRQTRHCQVKSWLRRVAEQTEAERSRVHEMGEQRHVNHQGPIL